MDKGTTHTSRPLNAIGPEPYRFGKLTPEQIEELADWFFSMHSNTDPAKVLPVPDFYRPVIAYMQLQAMDVELGDMAPWTLPHTIVDYYADLWYANRVSALRLIAASSGADALKGTHGSGPLFGSPFRLDRQGGNA